MPVPLLPTPRGNRGCHYECCLFGAVGRLNGDVSEKMNKEESSPQHTCSSLKCKWCVLYVCVHTCIYVHTCHRQMVVLCHVHICTWCCSTCIYVCAHVCCVQVVVLQRAYIPTPTSRVAPGSVAQASVKPRDTGQTAGSRASLPLASRNKDSLARTPQLSGFFKTFSQQPPG